MPVYKDKSGAQYDVPDDPTPAEQAELRKLGLTPMLSAEEQSQQKLTDVGKSALSGLTEGAIRAPFFLGDVGRAGLRYAHKTFPKIAPFDAPPPESQSDEVLGHLEDATGLKRHAPETTAGRYANSIASGVGGSWIGGPKALRPALSLARPVNFPEMVKALAFKVAGTPAVQGGGIGAASEFAGDVSRGFDETHEQNPIARAAGGGMAALFPLIAAYLRRSPSTQTLHNAVRDTTPDQFTAAQAQTTRLNRAGATQNTIGDSFPPTSQISPVENELSNTLGGQPLHSKLVGRGVEGGDIERLLGEGKTLAQRASVPNVSPIPGATGIDDMFAQGARDNRTWAANAEMSNAASMPALRLQAITDRLRRQGADPNLGTARTNSFNQAANTLEATPLIPTGPSVVPGLPPPAVVNPNALRDNLTAVKTTKPPEVDVPGAVKVNSLGLKQASQSASRLVGNEVPEIANANRVYQELSPQVQLTDLLAKNKMATRPNVVNSPKGLDDIRVAIARELDQINVPVGREVAEKFNAADTLSRNIGQRGMEGMNQALGQAPASIVAQPFQAVRRYFDKITHETANRELSNLLANPTPANYALLRQLAANNPELKRRLQKLGMMGSVNATTQSGGEGP